MIKFMNEFTLILFINENDLIIRVIIIKPITCFSLLLSLFIESTKLYVFSFIII